MLALDKVGGVATVLVLPANQLLASGNLAIVQVVGQDGELVLSGEVVLRSSNIFLNAVLILDILDGDVLQLDLSLVLSVESQVSSAVSSIVGANESSQIIEGELGLDVIGGQVVSQLPADNTLNIIGQNQSSILSDVLSSADNGGAIFLQEVDLDVGQLSSGLENSIEGSIAFVAIFLVVAQTGDTESLSIGIPSDNVSALALPANELVAGLGSNGGNVVLLIANFVLITLELDRTCTFLGEGALIGVNREGHVKVLSRGLGLFFVNSGSFDISNLIQVVDVIIGNQSIQALVRPIAGISFATDGPTSDVLIAVLGGSSYALANSNSLGNYNAATLGIQEANANFVVGSLRLLLINSGSLDISNLILAVDVIIGNQSVQALVRPIASISFATDSPANNVLVAVLGGSSYALTSSNGLSNYDAATIGIQEANTDFVVSSLRLLLINSSSLDISNLILAVDVIIGNQSVQALVRPIASISFATDSPANNVLVAVLGGSSYALASSNGLSSINATTISVQEANANLVVLLVSLKGVADESLTIKLATGIGVHLAIEHRISTIQNRGTLNIGIPLTAVSRRCLRSNFVFVQNILHRFFIALIKSDNDFTMRCKRCKRYAHDNHEHSRQQSKQTSFEVRFLHVNFSYSLVFI